MNKYLGKFLKFGKFWAVKYFNILSKGLLN